MKLDQRGDAKPQENHQHDKLREQKRRFVLRRRECMQCRHLQKRLNDADEAIKVERGHCSDDEDPMPCSPEFECVKRCDRYCKQDQRKRAHSARRIELAFLASRR